MLARTASATAVLILATVSVSCRPLARARPRGSIDRDSVVYADSIPANWGDLVSVNFDDENYTYILWMQDSTGTIRAVVYDDRNKQLMINARLIHRM